MATATAATAKKDVKEFIFAWEGRDKSGKTVKGEMRASGEALVNASLRRQGINVTKVRRQRGRLGKKITDKDITLFDYEQAALQPLPTTPFTLLQIKPVKVHPDCHVVLDGSYYSVPYRYIGQQLDAYVSDHLVELYDRVDLVVTHVRSLHPGQWQTRLEDYPPEKGLICCKRPSTAGNGPPKSVHQPVRWSKCC